MQTIIALTLISLMIGSVASINRVDNQIEREDVWNPEVKYISDANCKANQCLVMGMQRFSEPECGNLGQLGDPCRMYAEPEDKTLIFPNMIVKARNVYTQFCNCAKGLSCREARCSKSRYSNNDEAEMLDWDRFYD